jgi:hypothetical protein
MHMQCYHYNMLAAAGSAQVAARAFRPPSDANVAPNARARHMPAPSLGASLGIPSSSAARRKGGLKTHPN